MEGGGGGGGGGGRWVGVSHAEGADSRVESGRNKVGSEAEVGL